MTLQIPTLLALLGTALMAIVIFAPRRPPVTATATVSFAPPLAPPPVERWMPAPVEDDAFGAEPMFVSEPVFAPEPEPEPATLHVGWPELVDPTAAAATPDTRLRLAEALGAVRSPWALAVLEHARGEEPEPSVRAAIDAALAA